MQRRFAEFSPTAGTRSLSRNAFCRPEHAAVIETGFHESANALPETAPEAPGQLYDLEQDPGETTNLYFAQAEKRKELQGPLERLKSSGRSAPRRRTPIGIENIPKLR
jgi:hypothetical protein